MTGRRVNEQSRKLTRWYTRYVTEVSSPVHPLSADLLISLPSLPLMARSSSRPLWVKSRCVLNFAYDRVDRAQWYLLGRTMGQRSPASSPKLPGTVNRGSVLHIFRREIRLTSRRLLRWGHLPQSGTWIHCSDWRSHWYGYRGRKLLR